MRNKLLLLAVLLGACAQAAKTLDVYFIDVEGGQATLFVTPSNQSLLVDTGWPGFSARDANRIAAAAKEAGVNKIDYLVISHFHTDHSGGILQLAEKMPIGTFIDHGPSVETNPKAAELYADYEKTASKGKRITVKPGDTIPLKGADVTVVAANGEKIGKALPGGGEANPLCASATRQEEDKGENARSVGFVLRFGKFRIVDLGDLTWNKEVDLACPSNPIGAVDVYLTTHHGLNTSGADTLVHAMKPRVAIMNNGARKGGSPSAWQLVKKSPGLEDIWQLHFAVAGGKDNNAADSFIANPEENCSGQWLKLSAAEDGSFRVYNSRNKWQKEYKAR